MTNCNTSATTADASRPDRRVIRLPEVKRIVPYSKMHIYRLEKAGAFPRRIRFGVGRVGWWEDEILDWVANKQAASAA